MFKNIKSYLPYISGSIFSIIFGFSFLFTKEGLEIISPFHLLGFRFALAAVSLTILKIAGFIDISFKGKNIKMLLVLALFQPGLYFIFETSGIMYTTSSEAGMMIALIPVIVTIIGAIFLDEKPTFKQILFVILSVAGVLFIVLNRGSSKIEGNFLGLALLCGAVTAGALYNVLSRKLSLHFRPVEITYIMMWFGAILFNLISLVNKNFSLSNYFTPLTNIKVLSAVIYLGIFSSVIAFFMMNYTLSRINAAQAAVFANLTTVVSIIAGVFFRDESFYFFQGIGAFMIILGVWGTNYFAKPVKLKKEEL
ncbi:MULTISPECIES: DMT family transporter [unclassified Halanaerobium]|uniref:DMT family transporter n=1 Tax=Halanaerobium sp. MA284_MarDTE_T2 TaxID=2183913 RepID=UPI001F29EE41|nr:MULTISPECIES: DMT family transporter [unclassified Halanaerobium]